MFLNNDIFYEVAKYIEYRDVLNLAKCNYSIYSNLYTTLIQKQPPKHILVYGQVQGGKTKKIFELIQKHIVEKHVIVVIQNSLLVLKQYCERLKSHNIVFQILDSRMKIDQSPHSLGKVYIVMNNESRLSQSQKLSLNNRQYVLILDESDLIYDNVKEYMNCTYIYHVTASPFNSMRYDEVISITPDPLYYGAEKLFINPIRHHQFMSLIHDFTQEDGPKMMLINKFTFLRDMKSCANILSHKYPTIPIIVLSSERTLYYNNTKTIKHGSISSIIDLFINNDKIIFIANRLSNRGLSYTSSCYTRHLTHQITRVKSSPTSFVQGLRILGIYHDHPILKLYVTYSVHAELDTLNKHLDFLKHFDPLTKLKLPSTITPKSISLSRCQGLPNGQCKLKLVTNTHCKKHCIGPFGTKCIGFNKHGLPCVNKCISQLYCKAHFQV